MDLPHTTSSVVICVSLFGSTLAARQRVTASDHVTEVDVFLRLLGRRTRPDQGECRVYLVFHINEGRYGGVDLKGLNVAVAAHTPGSMGQGNWTVAAYLDDKASQQRQEGLGAIFTGAAGGPMSALVPLISRNLGAKVVPFSCRNEGKKRSARIPGILEAVVQAVPGSATPEQEVVKRNAHPLFPELVQASGVTSRYTDHGFRWDNTGKCADYTSFRWAGP